MSIIGTYFFKYLENLKICQMAAVHYEICFHFISGQVKDGSNEPLRHGGCLGLGLAAMGTHRADVYEQLKFNLYQDDAVTGEAAGLAMGLVELGSKSANAIQDMVAYAQETQHEKILRGLVRFSYDFTILKIQNSFP